MNVYFISGVGADRRVFRNIRLPDGFRAVHLDWITPHSEDTLSGYALRLAENIDAARPFVLVGLSFGGMLANEIAKVYAPQMIILISSVPSAYHLPPYFRTAGYLKLHKLVPISLLKSASLLKRLFTVETKEEKKFLREAIRNADENFIRWSLDAIVKWRCQSKPSRYIHIHGSSDYILPLRFAKATHVIKGGGHLMVLTNAREINQIISSHLLELSHNKAAT